MKQRKTNRAKVARGWWEAIAWGATAVLGVAAVSLVVASVVLLNPARREPGEVDVVVVIAGADDGRHALGAELIWAGVADNLVVSNPAGARDVVGSALCRGKGIPDHVNIWCMKPSPSTTTGEAQTFERLAQREGWHTAVAITNRPHHYRVRLNFSQCTSVDTTVVSIRDLDWPLVPYLLAREFGGYAKHFYNRPCQ